MALDARPVLVRHFLTRKIIKRFARPEDAVEWLKEKNVIPSYRKSWVIAASIRRAAGNKEILYWWYQWEYY